MEKQRSSRSKAFSSSTSNILAAMDGDGCKRSRSEVDISRGFIPSDMKDPNKKKILDDLTHKIFLSSDEEKLQKKKQSSGNVGGKRQSRPKYFYEKIGGSTYVNTTSVSKASDSEVRSPSVSSASSQKRNPNQMYTDSSYYHPQHHPSVAEQVKMAHQLSSSLFDDANKKSQGQEMFFKRVKTTDPSNKNKNPSRGSSSRAAPNMKLVMNPEGKLHDWTELPKEDLNELSRIASAHFNSQNNNRNNNGSSHFSSYKDIFESRRNIFSHVMTTHNSHNLNNNHSTSRWTPNNNRNNRNILVSGNQCYKESLGPSQQGYEILRSKTAPSIARPNLPKRGSSKTAVAAYDNRPPLNRFFV